jgi:hypothetical protein
MNINAFVVELVAMYRAHDCMDIDGADFQELFVKHGLGIERPITAEEAGQVWYEWDAEEGDLCVMDSEEFAALKQSVKA